MDDNVFNARIKAAMKVTKLTYENQIARRMTWVGIEKMIGAYALRGMLILAIATPYMMYEDLKDIFRSVEKPTAIEQKVNNYNSR